MTTSTRQTQAASQKSAGLTLFFILSFSIPWLALWALDVIAKQAGLANWHVLSNMAETTFSLGTIAEQLIVPPIVVYIISRVADFAPSIAGLITAFVIGGRIGVNELIARLFRWRVDWRWYAVALLLPAAMMLVAIGLFSLVSDVAIAANWQGLTSLGQILFWVLIAKGLLGGGLGEELGWRGFALPRLQARFHPLAASAILGLV